jgi:hypothetical protein
MPSKDCSIMKLTNEDKFFSTATWRPTKKMQRQHEDNGRRLRRSGAHGAAHAATMAEWAD